MVVKDGIFDEFKSFSGTEIAERLILGTKTGVNTGAKKFLVYGDPDIDGMIACYLVCEFLRLHGYSYEYYVNSNRTHGFTLPPDKLKGYTIIAVDFAIEEEDLKDILLAGASIVSIDHHAIKSTDLVHLSVNDCEGVIINNQYDFESKDLTFLSGAGVVYSVLSCIDSNFISDDNIGLVGISLLSDIRPTENSIAHLILDKTFNQSSPLFDRLISATANSIDYNFGVIRLDRNYIDYTFSPKFNSLFRANKGFEAIDFMVTGYLDKNLINACRRFQSLLVDYIMNNLVGAEYSNLTVMYIRDKPMSEIVQDILGYCDSEDKQLLTAYDFSDCLLSNYIGLVCSRIKGEGKTSFIYVHDGEHIIRGSVRGKLDNVDYLTIFQDLGITANGHSNAFGVFGDLNVDFQTVNYIIYNVEELAEKEPDSRVTEVSNLSIFKFSGSQDIATYNMYARSSMRRGIKYVGSPTYCKRDVTSSNKLFKWNVNGVIVKCFDKELTPMDNIILPVRERGYISFYLVKSI